MEELERKIVEQFAARRHRLNLSLRESAKEIGYSGAHLSGVVSRCRRPSPDMLIRMLEVLLYEKILDEEVNYCRVCGRDY